MAGRAGRGEGVVPVEGAGVIIGLMTTYALPRQPGKYGGRSSVTGTTGGGGVGSGQIPGMLKRRWHPCFGGMALSACGWESPGMRWSGRLVVIRLMTGHAIALPDLNPVMGSIMTADEEQSRTT